ncbi:hypothetical protein AYO22_01417 [Fonsecaea multimorphosa]|nr:hypothetical protein AYO22_01417 [Fonsecaea multimorphosa]
MDSSLYCHLNTEAKQIRLFHLEPAASYEDDLVGNLSTVSLLDNPQFQALSYVCGDAKNLKPMRLSGTDVSIYKNLDRALRHVRSEEVALTLWVDQLSIHQANLEERSQQVRLMSDIYNAALEVLVCIDSKSDTLPEEHKHVLGVVETVNTLGRLHRDEHYQRPIDLRGTWSDLLRFFKNGYWFRMWTTQELILAKKVTFYYDKYPISGETVDAFYTWYVKHMRYGGCCRVGDRSTLIDSAIDIAVRAYATTRENQIAKREGKVFKLLDLLSSVRHRLTTVLHDKVFALAGLAPLPAEILDYNATAEVTFERVAVYLIESTGTLDVFNHLSTNGPSFGSVSVAQSSARNVRNDYDRLPKLASWSPDWSMYFKSAEMIMLGERLELLPLYCASGTMVASVKHTGPKLLVPGVRCGVIAKVEVCYERPLIFNIGMIQAWSKLASVTLDDPQMSHGYLTSAKLRFIVALTGGIGVTADGAFFLMKSREDYLRNEYLFTYWWQLRMREEKEFTVYCPRDSVDVVQYYDEEYMESFAAQYEYALRRNCILRCFVVLEDGKFGFAPPTAMVGDLICVLKGGRTPFVLGTGKRVWTSRAGRARAGPRTSIQRSEPTPEEDGCFQLVGDAYIEGLMNSSVLTDAKEMEDFVLV